MGHAKPAPKPPQRSQEDVHTLIAQVLSLLPNDITPQQANNIRDVLTSVIPAAAVTPHVLHVHDSPRLQRVSHAHEQLRYWKAQHDARRKEQRQLDRQLDDAVAQIVYWQATLASATNWVPTWDTRGCDSAPDSLAGEQDEDSQGPTEYKATSAGADPSSGTAMADGTMLSNLPQPLVGTSSSLLPSPLTAERKEMAKSPMPHNVTLQPAVELRENTPRTEDSLSGSDDSSDGPDYDSESIASSGCFSSQDLLGFTGTTVRMPQQQQQQPLPRHPPPFAGMVMGKL